MWFENKLDRLRYMFTKDDTIPADIEELSKIMSHTNMPPDRIYKTSKEVKARIRREQELLEGREGGDFGARELAATRKQVGTARIICNRMWTRFWNPDPSKVIDDDTFYLFATSQLFDNLLNVFQDVIGDNETLIGSPSAPQDWWESYRLAAGEVIYDHVNSVIADNLDLEIDILGRGTRRVCLELSPIPVYPQSSALPCERRLGTPQNAATTASAGRGRFAPYFVVDPH